MAHLGSSGGSLEGAVVAHCHGAVVAHWREQWWLIGGSSGGSLVGSSGDSLEGAVVAHCQGAVVAHW